MTGQSWLVVANRSQARFFEIDKPTNKIKEIKTMHNAEGRSQNSDLVTDRPGRMSEPAPHTPGVDAMSSGLEPTERVLIGFAGEVASELDKARRKNKLASLDIIAEPSFLGALRNKLDKHVLDMVDTSIDKDVVTADDEQIRNYLKKF